MIVFAMSLIAPISAFASEEINYENEQLIAEAVLSQYGEFSLSKETELYNVNGDLEAVCFDFSPAGYVIVNIKNYEVPEFSPYASSYFVENFSQEESSIYNGPLSYYTKIDNNHLQELTTGNIVATADLSHIYDVEQDNILKVDTLNKLDAPTTYVSSTYITQHVPATWDSNSYCGVDGSAIILNYLHNYHDSNLIPSGKNSNKVLQKYLVEANYLNEEGMSAKKLVNGTLRYTGLNSFFVDRNSSISATYVSYSRNFLVTMQHLFSNDYPVLLGTDTVEDDSSWEYGEHWLIAYGYTYQDLTGGRLIVNDGWGKAGIFVTTDPLYYDYVIYFQ